MVDESDSNNQDRRDAKKKANGRSKRRRSLFSALFQSKSASSNKTKDSEDNDNKSTLSQSFDGEIVIIEPKDAKCIEATIVGTVHSHDEPEARRGQGNKCRDEDADSYEIDLNDQLEAQRLRAISEAPLGNGKSSSESPALSREQSPLVGGLWQTNDNYIPIQQRPADKLKKQNNTDNKSVRRKSPMLEKFFNSYQIQLDSTSSNEDGSSCDSWPCANRQPFDISNRSDNLLKVKPNHLTGADRRLTRWRALATRASLWSANSPQSSSLNSDIDDSLDSEGPALVCYCSDDTSCSSVELVWSRPQLARHQQLASPQINIRSPTATSPSEVSLSLIERQKVNNKSIQQHQTNDISKCCQVQRPSIFELAKPSRARDRQIGERRRRSDKNMGPKEKLIGSRTSGEWVANPLFTTHISNEDLSRPIERVDSNDRFELDVRDELVATCLPGADGKQVNESVSRRLTTTDGPITIESTNFVDDTNKTTEDEEQFENLDGFSLTESAFSERDKKHRWSLRVRSPFGTRRGDNAYLSHLINLDRRIKSNVSSLKSQLSERLSDTGKRASVLADQLITSIKDTTKEQLLFTSVGTKERYDTLPNSFATNNKLSTSMNDHSFGNDSSTDSRKAQLFSLIYKHQQQANGQPVITRQPKPIGIAPQRPIVGVKIESNNHVSNEPQQSTINKQTNVSPGEIQCQAIEDLNAPPNRNIIAASEAVPRRKRRRPRAARRQINVAPLSGDEDSDKDHHEHVKLRPRKRNVTY